MKKKIHILYTIPNFNTVGGAKALYNIATRLDRDRFDVSIAIFHTEGAFFENVRATGIPVHVFTFTAPMENRLNGLLNTWRISRKFRKLDVDVVHSWHYLDDYTEPLAVRLSGKKWVFTKNNMAWDTRAWKLRSALANGIVVQNTDMIRDFFPDKKNLALIPRGINTTEFSPRPVVVSLQQKHRLPHGCRVIMCVANLVPVKGIEVLLQAFGSIANKYPDTYLMIVGDDTDEYGAAMKKMAATSPYSGRIIFTGKQFNINEYLTLAEIVVLPTLDVGRKESFGVAVLEAMAMEKYVLASDLAGPREQLKNFPSLLVQPGNSEALSILLDKTLSLDKSELAETGRKLRQEVIDRFSIEREVENHEKFYESLYK
jgi:glycosyltransferase involved in cell wall biosynthesis